MKVLSLLQPWASLWVAGPKGNETRSWRTQYRGPVAVAASAKIKRADRSLCFREPFSSALASIGFSHPGALPLGALLGWVEVTGTPLMVDENCEPGDFCVRCDPSLTEQERAFGIYCVGRHAWLTAPERHVLAEPIPFKGGLGLRDLAPDIERQLLAAPSVVARSPRADKGGG